MKMNELIHIILALVFMTIILNIYIKNK